MERWIVTYKVTLHPAKNWIGFFDSKEIAEEKAESLRRVGRVDVKVEELNEHIERIKKEKNQ